MSDPKTVQKIQSGLAISLEASGSGYIKLDRGALFVVYNSQSKKTELFWCQTAALQLNGLKSWLQSVTQGSAKNLEIKAVFSKSEAGSYTGLATQFGVTKAVEIASGSDVFVLGESGKVRFENQPHKAETKKERTRVLIVDDSKTICDLLVKVFSSDPEIEVVGAVRLPSEVEGVVEKTKPHVITMDIHMPEMTGVELVKKLLPRFPIPTVMISSVSMEDGEHVLKALEYGAVDYIQKPSMGDLDRMIPVIIEKIKQARYSHVRVPSQSLGFASTFHAPTLSDAILNQWTIAIGSSTGGTEALRRLFKGFPEKIPPVVVVQHIPPVFSAAFAKSLNDSLPYECLEAKDGDELKPNRILIAPGATQMKVKRSPTGGLKVEIFDGPPVNRHKPSVDVLFDSIAKDFSKKTLGVILTGMGADGAKGLLAMRNAGSPTFGQDEASCVVYGMPRAAAELGAVETVSGLDRMAEQIFKTLDRITKVKGSKAA